MDLPLVKTIFYTQKKQIVERVSNSLAGWIAFLFSIWFIHPSKEFDTLSEDAYLSNQLSILHIKSE